MNLPKRNKSKPRKLFSTGDVSELVGVTSKTVAVWIDKGELKGVRLPGMLERRVHREELRQFLIAYEYIWAIRELDIEEGKIPAALPAPLPKPQPRPANGRVGPARGIPPTPSAKKKA